MHHDVRATVLSERGLYGRLGKVDALGVGGLFLRAAVFSLLLF